MSLPELDQEFRALTQDPLDLADIRTSINLGVDRHQRRRRTTALVASAAAVLVVAAGISVVHEIGITSAPVATVPDWHQQARPLVIPAGSTLIPYTVRDVISPVTATVDGPSARDEVTWQQDVNTLSVAWRYPNAAGIATASPVNGSTLTPAEMDQRAYVITTTRDLPRSQPAAPPPGGGAVDLATQTAATPTTPTTTSAPVSTVIGGHQVVIADDTQSAVWVTIGQTRWASWQLTDKRWIHVWVRTGGDAALIAFAQGIVETPSTITRQVTVGVTAPGYTVEGASESGTPTALSNGSVELCPSGTTTMFATSVTPPCLWVYIVPTPTPNRDLTGTIRTVTVDGLATHINKTTRESFANIGHGFSIFLGDDPNHPLSDLDVATLAASVRVDPNVKLGPN